MNKSNSIFFFSIKKRMKNNLLKLAVAEFIEAPPNILSKAKHNGHFDKLNDL